ncbi:MAG: hypothetical protein RL385_499 [Pseudomonadota bacterium]
MTEESDLESFARLVVNNLQKQGFPERKVAFPLERLYESAHSKGLNFNQVLSLLATWGIEHEKTPEKLIFLAAPRPAATTAASPFAGVDFSMLQNLSPAQMMAMVSQAMEQMGPEQLSAIQDTLGNMTEEERAQMLEQAKMLGLVPG